MIFDGHSDTWTDVIAKQTQGEVDILNRYHYEKFIKGGVNGSIFVIWSDPPYDAEPLLRTRQIMEAVEKEMKYAENHFRIVHDYNEYMAAVKDNRIAIFIGLEGLSSIGRNIEMIDEFHKFGARHASLTWNEENELATGVLGNPERGLSKLGEEAYKRISGHNMLFDVSHLNEKSYWDVARIADRPFMASHSNCKALSNVPRNLTDDQVKEIAMSGGYIGINSFNQFVHDDMDKQNVKYLVDHIVHITDLVGIQHVALGFDYCDYIDESSLSTFSTQETSFTKGLVDASDSMNIVIEMEKRGFSQKEIEKVASKNVLDLIKRIMK